MLPAMSPIETRCVANSLSRFSSVAKTTVLNPIGAVDPMMMIVLSSP